MKNLLVTIDTREIYPHLLPWLHNDVSYKDLMEVLIEDINVYLDSFLDKHDLRDHDSLEPFEPTTTIDYIVERYLDDLNDSSVEELCRELARLAFKTIQALSGGDDYLNQIYDVTKTSVTSRKTTLLLRRSDYHRYSGRTYDIVDSLVTTITRNTLRNLN